jgi:hypothetical protein
MPRFFLHVCNGTGFDEDLNGELHRGLFGARSSAISRLRAALTENLQNGNINVAAFVEIEDENHRHLETVHFTDAVAVQTKSDRKAR